MTVNVSPSADASVSASASTGWSAAAMKWAVGGGDRTTGQRQLSGNVENRLAGPLE